MLRCCWSVGRSFDACPAFVHSSATRAPTESAHPLRTERGTLPSSQGEEGVMNRARLSLVPVLLLTSAFIGSYAFGQSKNAAATNTDQVQCKDGTFSKKGSGACSHHGGVAGPAPAADAKSQGTAGKSQGTGGSAVTTPNPNPGAIPPGSVGTPSSKDEKAAKPTDGKATKPTARCKDGTFSYSANHTGACSHHGGVDQWLDTK